MVKYWYWLFRWALTSQSISELRNPKPPSIRNVSKTAEQFEIEALVADFLYKANESQNQEEFQTYGNLPHISALDAAQNVIDHW